MCFHFAFGRDLKKAELQLSAEKAKVDSRLQNMDFLKAKAAEFRFGIKAAEVRTKRCGEPLELWSLSDLCPHRRKH